MATAVPQQKSHQKHWSGKENFLPPSFHINSSLVFAQIANFEQKTITNSVSDPHLKYQGTFRWGQFQFDCCDFTADIFKKNTSMTQWLDIYSWYYWLLPLRHKSTIKISFVLASQDDRKRGSYKPHTVHVWYIQIHLVGLYGKCK